VLSNGSNAHAYIARDHRLLFQLGNNQFWS